LHLRMNRIDRTLNMGTVAADDGWGKRTYPKFLTGAARCADVPDRKSRRQEGGGAGRRAAPFDSRWIGAINPPALGRVEDFGAIGAHPWHPPRDRWRTFRIPPPCHASDRHCAPGETGQLLFGNPSAREPQLRSAVGSANSRKDGLAALSSPHGSRRGRPTSSRLAAPILAQT